MATTNTTPSIMTLFGPSSLDEYQMQRQQSDMAKAMAMAQSDVDPVRQAMAYGGMQLGRGVNQLLGAPDPELDRQTKLMQIQKEFQDSGLDAGDPDHAFPFMINTLNKYGLTKEALMASDQYRQMKLARDKQAADTLEAQAKWVKANTEKEMRTRVNEDVGRVGGALGFGVKKFLEEYTPEQLTAINEKLQEMKSKVAKAGATSVVNNVSAKSFGQEAGKEVGKEAATIEGKYSALDSITEAEDVLNKGIYTGGYAKVQAGAAKYSGGLVGDKDKLARTQEFVSYIGNTVVPRLKEFGGNDSNEELKYLQGIMAGDIEMEDKAIKRVLSSAKRKIQRGIERVQRNKNAIAPDSGVTTDPGPSRDNAAPKPKQIKLKSGAIVTVEG